ncbi:hypothetical protein IQ251_10800 [Saccharopolyspora sp. HNM0983]|uniref:Uncharacterized protein n=1 Tax=Saccharopolyspora montiporae TaxID=2781240 RepID=A0A929FXQ8_9PSEU|nr:hypothetical protein [Saccharopolyspora sp. HNM0983]MBE9374931.1 hypothetical protein [Saccharopolyspora sp. HNM0983]
MYKISDARSTTSGEVAAQAGLSLTPTVIEHPGPEPAKMPMNGPGPDTTERTPGEEQAIAGYQAKVEAFNEASATVKEARRKEESAHDSLQSALKMTKSLPESLVPQGWAWAPVVTGAYSGAYATAKALNKIADSAQQKADSARALLDKPGLSPAERQQALRGYLDGEGKARPASTGAQSAQRLDDMIPGNPKVKEGLSTSIKGAGVVGLATTGASVYQDIQKGVPKDKAITKGAASTGASAGVGAGMTALAAGGYIGGVAATGGTLLIGTAVAAGVGWAVDNYYDDVKNWLTD